MRRTGLSWLLSAALIAGGGSAAAQEVDTPALGGPTNLRTGAPQPGGKPFRAPCPDGGWLTGVRVRAGDCIDAVALLCSRWDETSRTMSPPEPASAFFGGQGGVERDSRCDADSALVAFEIGLAMNSDRSVGLVQPRCNIALAPYGVSALASGETQHGKYIASQVRNTPTPTRIRNTPIQDLSCPAGHLAAGCTGRPACSWTASA